MKLQLARRVLSVLAFLLAVFIISVGIINAYIDGLEPSDVNWFSANETFAIHVVVSAFPFFGSYILWPN